ncbi:MAG: hypothetical protein LAP21_07715 [Acidobacteriia bacterium]|nr:hypothetical protein [Terriglobia bacterium]
MTTTQVRHPGLLYLTPHSRVTIGKVQALSSNQVHELLLAEACFQQAIEGTRLALLREQISWHDFTRVAEHSETLRRRLTGPEDEKAVRMSFDAAARGILAPGLAAFEEFKDVEGCSFQRAVVPGLHLLVRCHEVHGLGIGKMFELEIGISIGPPDSHMFSPAKFITSAFRLFGDELTRPTWSYDTHAEMEICARETLELLRRVLPRLEAALRKYFEPWPKALPDAITGGRTVSARQALTAALTQAGRAEDEIELRFVNSVPRLANITTDIRREFPILSDGRLGRLGAWRIIGVLRGHPAQELIADVPFEGPVRVAWHNIRTRSPGIHEWIDSTEAAAKIREQVGDGFDPSTLTLQGYAPAHWLTHLEKQFCRIDAISGELLK